VTRGAEIATWSDEALERRVQDAVSLNAPWPLVEALSRLVRLSGSADERQALAMLMARLDAWQVPHRLHEPMCFISIPGPAGVRCDGTAYRAKTPAMSASTGGAEVPGELVYVPGTAGDSPGDVFSTGVEFRGTPVAGKIVVTEGLASPGKVNDLMAARATAGIFVNPGPNIYEGICTTVWGTPDLDSAARQPSIPVVAVNRPDGEALIQAAQQRRRASVATQLETGWRTRSPDDGCRRSSCCCTGTSTGGTPAWATMPPATRRCWSWRASSGACGRGSPARSGSPGGPDIPTAATPARPGTPTPRRSTWRGTAWRR
jgi:hypothetical protein